MYNEAYIKHSISIPITIFEEIDSSNEEAKRRIAEGANEDFALVSKAQTAGKGRKGRSFYSPKDTGIYLTFVHFSDNNVEDDLSVTVCSSVLVKNAIKESLNIECGIKWVNDLYYKEKKICGILCECVLKGSLNNAKNAIIVGIGINLSTSDFPEEIMDKAGSLIDNKKYNHDDTCSIVDNNKINGKNSDYSDIAKGNNKNNVPNQGSVPDSIVISIINGLSDFFANKPIADIMEEYRNSSIITGKTVELSDAKGTIAKGTVEGFDDTGAIIVNCDGDICLFNSGEISLIVM